MTESKKIFIDVIQAQSLRDLVRIINDINRTYVKQNQKDKMILREDIVKVIEKDNSYFLLYYKQ